MKLENKKLTGELEWYMSGVGSDPGRTNLTSMLVAEQGIKSAEQKGKDIANNISKSIEESQATRINLELKGKEQDQEIGKETLQGRKYENIVKGETLISEISQKQSQAIIAGLTSDRVKREFEDYKSWRKYVDIVQDALDGKGKKGFQGTLDALLALAYTSLIKPDGSSGSIIPFIK